MNQQQKEIIDILRSLTGKYSLWDVWRDFVSLMAISIANSVPDFFSEDREQTYKNISQKYETDEMQRFVQAFTLMIVAINQHPQQDFLGSLFMNLNLSNRWKGQFFTPYNVCELMAELTYVDKSEKEIQEKGWISVNDPCCGAGALLIAFANICMRYHVNYQTSVFFMAQDIDLLAGMMCYIQLSLLGCAGYVIIGDSLCSPVTEKDLYFVKDNPNIWVLPMILRPEWQMRNLKTE